MTDNQVTIGHNSPPSPIDAARDAWAALAKYLADTPVIQDEDTARGAKLQLDRGKSTLGDLEAAMKAEADPLRKIWMDTREKYTPAINNITKVVELLETRIKAFMRAEENRRAEEAAAKIRAAQEAERLAREAEKAEREALDNAAVGEVGVDVAAATEQADAAFSRFQKTEREAKLAVKDTKVRLGGGFGKTLTMRTRKVAVLDDWKAAIEAIGLTDDIREAILKSAKAFKTMNGSYPNGVSEIEERS